MKGRRPKASTRSKLVAVLVFLAIFAVLNIVLTVPALLLYQYNYMSYNSLYFVSSAALSLSFSLSVLCYFIFYKKTGLRSIATSLGLGRSAFGPNMILYGIVIFAILFLMELVISVISYVTNVAINSNVALLLNSAPLWFYVFTAIIAPINEEILFRGFLVPRLGIVASALLFAAGHATYNSTFGIEIIAALIFGLIAGYVYKRTNSLYPSMIAHIILNASTLLITFMVLA